MVRLSLSTSKLCISEDFRKDLCKNMIFMRCISNFFWANHVAQPQQMADWGIEGQRWEAWAGEGKNHDSTVMHTINYCSHHCCPVTSLTAISKHGKWKSLKDFQTFSNTFKLNNVSKEHWKLSHGPQLPNAAPCHCDFKVGLAQSATAL